MPGQTYLASFHRTKLHKLTSATKKAQPIGGRKLLMSALGSIGQTQVFEI
jgi:hypothetical protein